MSTNTGVAPSRLTQPAVAKNEYVGVMTSSPGPMPSAISATSSASVPDETPIAWSTSSCVGELALERVDLGAEDEPLAVADARDGREDLVADRRGTAPCRSSSGTRDLGGLAMVMPDRRLLE